MIASERKDGVMPSTSTNSRREREEALIAEAQRGFVGASLDLAWALEAAHKREDAIRKLIQSAEDTNPLRATSSACRGVVASWALKKILDTEDV